VNPPVPPHTLSFWDLWAWRKFLDALDEAGFAIVEKPKLKDKGHTAPR
jgi:hypothetical protein